MAQIEISSEFQTPPAICDYMAQFIPDYAGSILEPTPGKFQLVNAVKSKGTVYYPDNDFFDMEHCRYDWIIMNPPFSPMKKGYEILYRCMDMSDNIVALMPWLTIINSQKRAKDIMLFGLKSVTNLPRNAFPGSRVQCCILEMRKGYTGTTSFINI